MENGLYDVPPGKLATIVTHLEMTAPRPGRDVDLAPGLRFREAEPDIGWYRDIFDRVGAPWLWYGRRRMDDAALWEIIADPHVTLHTIEREGRAEALLELDFREKGACELAYFGLTPALIGSGAGRYLMNRAVALAWARPIDRFHVHTCTIDSPQALNFYIRSGFVPYKRQVEIDDDPRLKGLLPEESGRHVPLIR